MYLIWILDNYDVHNQGQLERDIKYLTKYQNFFKLDEKEDEFKLECKYKSVYLTKNNKLLTKWSDKSVALNEVQFDPESYQIYYYNFGDNITKTEEEQKRIEDERNEAEKKKLAEEKLVSAKAKCKAIIQDIKKLRDRKAQNFQSAADLINELDDFELEILNSTLNFLTIQKANKPVLNYWISIGTQDDFAFLKFILDCKKIQLDVNAKDSNGITAFLEVYQNKDLIQYNLIKLLLKRGYQLTEADQAHIVFNSGDNERKYDMLLYQMCEKLVDKNLVDSAFPLRQIIFIIESAKRKEILGFNYKPNEWIAFANNALYHHTEYWEYIEVALKKYGLWDQLIKLDKKASFQKKVQHFYTEMPVQKFDFDAVYYDLYPELTNDLILY